MDYYVKKDDFSNLGNTLKKFNEMHPSLIDQYSTEVLCKFVEKLEYVPYEISKSSSEAPSFQVIESSLRFDANKEELLDILGDSDPLNANLE